MQLLYEGGIILSLFKPYSKLYSSIVVLKKKAKAFRNLIVLTVLHFEFYRLFARSFGLVF